VLELFAIRPDHDLAVMGAARGLSATTALMLERLDGVLGGERPDRVLVHGDTATTLAASIAAYYRRIPVGHVEAGLRTADLYQPWPEEMNRRVADVIADQYFAPTGQAQRNLLGEGKPAAGIHVTGNTVIDALFATLATIDRSPLLEASLARRFAFLVPGRRLLLATGHRRENFGPPFRSMCEAIGELALRYDLDVVFPVHLNPEVSVPVNAILGAVPRVHLVPPLEYLPFVYLMRRASVILTDSGGIQEEAPSLGRPVFVMRNVTERPEAVEAGTVRLVGTERARIVAEVSRVLESEPAYRAMSSRRNPYGDGRAAERIASIVAGRGCEPWQCEAAA
jgi:UDP-N-acetylglucosamine 2-epimerase